MSGNTFKVKQESARGSFFSWVEKHLRLQGFDQGIPLRFMPQLLFLTFLLIFYIGNKHFAEKTIRKIDSIEGEVEDRIIVLKDKILNNKKDLKTATNNVKIKKIEGEIIADEKECIISEES